MRNSTKRNIAKSISYRVVGIGATTLIAMILVQDARIALSIGILDTLVKLFLYSGHEHIWNRIRWLKPSHKPFVIWLTGFSGAGKSSISEALLPLLKNRDYKVQLLDGDEIRHIFPNTGFDADSRERHIKRVGYMAAKLESNGICTIVAMVSPYRSSRGFCRDVCANFIEVHVATPLSVCERRDAKGLYAKARQGLIRDLTGVDAPYEAPEHAEIVVSTEHQTPAQCAASIASFVRRFDD